MASSLRYDFQTNLIVDMEGNEIPERMLFDTLYKDITVKILSVLPYKALKAFSSTSKTAGAFVLKNKIWKFLVMRDYRQIYNEVFDNSIEYTKMKLYYTNKLDMISQKNGNVLTYWKRLYEWIVTKPYGEDFAPNYVPDVNINCLVGFPDFLDNIGHAETIDGEMLLFHAYYIIYSKSNPRRFYMLTKYNTIGRPQEQEMYYLDKEDTIVTGQKDILQIEIPHNLPKTLNAQESVVFSNEMITKMSLSDARNDFKMDNEQEPVREPRLNFRLYTPNLFEYIYIDCSMLACFVSFWIFPHSGLGVDKDFLVSSVIGHHHGNDLLELLKNVKKKKKLRSNGTVDNFFIKHYGDKKEWNQLEQQAILVDKIGPTSSVKKLLVYIANTHFEMGHATLWKLNTDTVRMELVAVADVAGNEKSVQLRKTSGINKVDDTNDVLKGFAINVLQKKYGFKLVRLIKDGEIMPTFYVPTKQDRWRFFYTLLRQKFEYAPEFDHNSERRFQKLQFVNANIQPLSEKDYRTLVNRWSRNGYTSTYAWVVKYLELMSQGKKQSLKEYANGRKNQLRFGLTFLKEVGIDTRNPVFTVLKSPIKKETARDILGKLLIANQQERGDARVFAAMEIGAEKVTEIVKQQLKKRDNTLQAALEKLQTSYTTLQNKNRQLSFVLKEQTSKLKDANAELNKCLSAALDHEDRELPPTPEELDTVPVPIPTLKPEDNHNFVEAIQALQSQAENSTSSIIRATTRVPILVKQYESQIDMTTDSNDNKELVNVQKEKKDIENTISILKDLGMTGLPICDYCGDFATRICDCKAALYCSTACDEQHWIEHKLTCDARF